MLEKITLMEGGLLPQEAGKCELAALVKETLAFAVLTTILLSRV